MGKKFLIIDDSALMRRVISDIIKENYDDVEALDTAVNGLEGFDKLVSKPGYYDLVILDINMPKKNGLEVLKSLKSRRSKLKVLVLTVHNETEYLMKAVDIGVNGYVLKDSESAELKKAIFTVADGETYIQPSLIPALNAKMIETNKDAEKIKSLTKRELDVLKLLAVGMFNKEVGKRLEIS